MEHASSSSVENQAIQPLQPMDVVFGKGRQLNHKGNKNFLVVVRKHMSLPGTAPAKAQVILDAIATQNGRFVDLAPGTTYEQGQCMLVSNDRALVKIGYTVNNELKKTVGRKSAAQTPKKHKTQSSDSPYEPRPPRRPKATVPPVGRKQTSSSPAEINTCRTTRSASTASATAAPVFVSVLELDNTDVIMDPSSSKKHDGRPGNIGFMNIVRVLCKVYPQVSHKHNVKVRVAAKVLEAVYAMDPPGCFVEVCTDKPSKFRVLTDNDAIRWICTLLDTMPRTTVRNDAPGRVQNHNWHAPHDEPQASRLRLGFTDGMVVPSPMSDHDAAGIMLDMHEHDHGAMDYEEEDLDSLATQRNDYGWRGSHLVLSPLSSNTPSKASNERMLLRKHGVDLDNTPAAKFNTEHLFTHGE